MQKHPAHIVRVALLRMVVHMRVIMQIRCAVRMVRREVLVMPELVVRGERGDCPVKQMCMQTSGALLRGGRRGGYVDLDLKGLRSRVRAVSGGGGGIVRT